MRTGPGTVQQMSRTRNLRTCGQRLRLKGQRSDSVAFTNRNDPAVPRKPHLGRLRRAGYTCLREFGQMAG